MKFLLGKKQSVRLPAASDSCLAMTEVDCLVALCNRDLCVNEVVQRSKFYWRKDMKIDRKRVMKVFARYTENYDITDEKIKLKVDHTYRMAGLCDRIARSLELSDKDVYSREK